MIVNAKEMLIKAKAGHYAVGHFNINNLEWTKCVLLTAQELNSPVILGVSEGAGKYMGGFKTVADMAKAMDESLKIRTKALMHASRPASHLSCSTARIIPFRKIWRRRESLHTLLML